MSNQNSISMIESFSENINEISSLYSSPYIEPPGILSDSSEDSIIAGAGEFTNFQNPQVQNIKIKTKNLRSYVKSRLNDMKIESSLMPNVSKSKCPIHGTNDHSMCTTECKIIDQIKTLQNDVHNMNQRLNSREEILKVKEKENLELKEAIKRLESNINVLTGTAATEYSIHEDENLICSCQNKCTII